jgi:putative addiction module CopG family antidote
MGMTSMNISLPRAMREFVEGQVATGGYGTVSEYVRALIREAHTRVRGEVRRVDEKARLSKRDAKARTVKRLSAPSDQTRSAQKRDGSRST